MSFFGSYFSVDYFGSDFWLKGALRPGGDYFATQFFSDYFGSRFWQRAPQIPPSPPSTAASPYGGGGSGRRRPRSPQPFPATGPAKAPRPPSKKRRKKRKRREAIQKELVRRGLPFVPRLDQESDDEETILALLWAELLD